VVCFDQRATESSVSNRFQEDVSMNEHTKRPAFTDAEVRRELVNDSLGTVDSADSTGSDETKETGDAKKGNTNTRED